MPLPLAPCDPWVTPEEIAELACYDAAAEVGNEALALATADWATGILHSLSESPEGLCTMTTWPKLPGCHAGVYCEGCSINRYKIDLGLVSSVTTVTVVDEDGTETVIPGGSRRLDDWRWLVRTDGELWPHWRATDDSPYGVRVTAVYGVEPSAAAKRAAAILASEEMKRCLNQACQLPSRVRTISMQGQSFSIMDPMEMIDKRRTGIYQVDLWLRAADHYGDARLFDPGSADQHIFTGT